MEEDLHTKLKRQVDVCDWQMLIPSFTRGILVYLDSSLDIIETAIHITEDSAKLIKDYMTEGKLANVTDEQHQEWLLEPKLKFHMLVVTPYVLIQKIIEN